MPQWATFVGLAGVVTVLLLALAHASQRAIEEQMRALDEPEEPPDPESRSKPELESDPESESDPERESRPEAEPEAEPESTSPSEPDPGPTSSDSHPGPEPEPKPEITPGLLLVNVALSQGLFALVLIAAAWYTQIPPAALGIGAGVTGVEAVGIGLGLGFVLYLASEVGQAVATRLGFDHDEQLREMLAPDSPTGWAVLMGVVLPIIAVFEEFLFRAALIGAVAVGYGVSPWLLAVISSILFALGHGAQGRTGIVVTGLLGFVLAGAFIVTESLLVVVVAHYVVNALEFAVHEGLGFEWT